MPFRCLTCGGTGIVVRRLFLVFWKTISCPVCDGKGRFDLPPPDELVGVRVPAPRKPTPRKGSVTADTE